MPSKSLDASIWEALLSGLTSADAKSLAERCVREPKAMATVVEASRSESTMTRAFAFHTIKQVATMQPKLLEPFRESLLDIGHEGEFWTVPLLAAQAITRLDWPAKWHARIWTVFKPYLDTPNKFAAAWTLRVLWPLAKPGSERHSFLLKTCDRFIAAGGAQAASARIVMRRPISGGKSKK